MATEGEPEVGRYVVRVEMDPAGDPDGELVVTTNAPWEDRIMAAAAILEGIDLDIVKADSLKLAGMELAEALFAVEGVEDAIEEIRRHIEGDLDDINDNEEKGS